MIKVVVTANATGILNILNTKKKIFVSSHGSPCKYWSSNKSNLNSFELCSTQPHLALLYFSIVFICILLLSIFATAKEYFAFECRLYKLKHFFFTQGLHSQRYNTLGMTTWDEKREIYKLTMRPRKSYATKNENASNLIYERGLNRDKTS